MTTAELIAAYTKKIKQKDALYNCIYTHGYTKNQQLTIDILNNMSLESIYHAMIDAEIEFTQKHFDDFVTQAIYKKTASYLVKKGYNYEVLMYFFTIFTPTQPQLDQIFTCFSKPCRYPREYVWVDCLVNNNYPFTQENIGKLKLMNYDQKKLLCMSSNVTLDQVDKMLETYKTSDYDYLKKVLIKNKLNTTSKTLNNMLSSLESKIINSKDMLSSLSLLIERGSKADQDTLKIFLRRSRNDSIIALFDLLLKTNKDIVITTSLLEKSLIIGDNITMFILLLERSKTSTSTSTSTGENKDNILNLYLKNHSEVFRDRLDQEQRAIIVDLKLEAYIDASHYFNIFNYLVKEKKYKVNIDTLNIIASKESSSLEYFKKIVSSFKIMPDKSTLDKSVLNSDILTEVLNYKIIPDTSTVKSIFTSPTKNRLTTQVVGNIVEKLIKYGLKVNLDVLDTLLENKYTLLELERFNIKYDEQLYFVCHINDYFPKEYVFTEINEKVLHLRKMCKEGINASNIVKHLVENKLKLDRYCFDNSISMINRYNTGGKTLGDFMYFVLKLEPPLVCMSNPINSKLVSSIYKSLCIKHKIDYKYMSSTYDVDEQILVESI